MTFLKTATRITGDDLSLLEKCPPESRRKVIALASAAIIPALLWGISTALFLAQVQETGIGTAVVGGLLAATLIFSIERLVIMGRSNFFLGLFRVLIALAVAYLGAVFIDVLVFRDDIRSELPQLRHEEAMRAQSANQGRFDEEKQVTAKLQEVQHAKVRYEALQNSANFEAEGLSSNGIKGAGSATAHKQRVADQARSDWQKLQAEYEELIRQRAAGDSLAYAEALAGFNEHGLLKQVNAMHRLMKQERAMSWTYWAFTLLMLGIELMPLIFKATFRQSAYEHMVDRMEALHRQRVDMAYGPGSEYLQPHNVHRGANTLARQLRQSSMNML